jgi:hypothetical protein
MSSGGNDLIFIILILFPEVFQCHENDTPIKHYVGPQFTGTVLFREVESSIFGVGSRFRYRGPDPGHGLL